MHLLRFVDPFDWKQIAFNIIWKSASFAGRTNEWHSNRIRNDNAMCFAMMNGIISVMWLFLSSISSAKSFIWVDELKWNDISNMDHPLNTKNSFAFHFVHTTLFHSWPFSLSLPHSLLKVESYSPIFVSFFKLTFDHFIVKILPILRFYTYYLYWHTLFALHFLYPKCTWNMNNVRALTKISNFAQKLHIHWYIYLHSVLCMFLISQCHFAIVFDVTEQRMKKNLI